jgi:hypothetical protein
MSLLAGLQLPASGQQQGTAYESRAHKHEQHSPEGLAGAQVVLLARVDADREHERREDTTDPEHPLAERPADVSDHRSFSHVRALTRQGCVAGEHPQAGTVVRSLIKVLVSA